MDEPGRGHSLGPGCRIASRADVRVKCFNGLEFAEGDSEFEWPERVDSVLIGWNISVFRIVDEISVRQTLGGPFQDRIVVDRRALGDRVAVWQAGPYGLAWLRQAAGEDYGAVSERECGYPHRYIVPSASFLETFLNRRPHVAPIYEQPHWVVPEESVGLLRPGYLGKTTVDEAAVNACADDKWLYVEAWDES